MKKFTLILVLFFTLQQSFSYTWESYGPEGIKATNLFFLWQDDIQPLIIFSDSGMFYNVNGLVTWEYYAYTKEAVQLNYSTILVLASSGSYSDGIYSFNIQTHQIDVVEYCIKPAFIKFDDQAGVYYVGCEDGLLKSGDGLNWENVPFFNGKNCVGMVFIGDHIVVNVLADLTHLYLSDNGGSSWVEASGCPGWIQSMVFRGDGKLFGIFPDNSYSSGLWSSDDFGDNWDVEFYSTDMNTVSTAEGESFVLVGWTNSVNDYEGLAIYDPDVPPPGLTFLNETLSNLNINMISYRLLICSGAVLYVCTDNGVYSCWDYFVGIDEQTNQNNSINIFPNPVSSQATIKINLTEPVNEPVSIFILNNQGQKVDEIMAEGNNSNEMIINWNKGNLPGGIYYFVFEIEKEQISEKFIIL